MTSRSEEDYLGAIFEFEEASREAKTGNLASRLSVNDASVTEMLKKLAGEDYVTYEPYKGARLTAKGRRLARRLKRKHRIVERFLYDILGIRKERVHEQACGMEHVISDEVEGAMEEMLEDPRECPDDGKPIPPAPKKKTSEKTLLSAKKGSTVAVRELSGGSVFQEKLRTMGIREGKKLKVVAREPAGGPLVVKSGNTTITIGRGMARKILVG